MSTVGIPAPLAIGQDRACRVEPRAHSGRSMTGPHLRQLGAEHPRFEPPFPTPYSERNAMTPLFCRQSQKGGVDIEDAGAPRQPERKAY